MAVNYRYKSRPTRALKADVWIARATERWRGRLYMTELSLNG